MLALQAANGPRGETIEAFMSRRIRELAGSDASSASAITGFQNYYRPPPDNSPAFQKAKADFKRGTDELAFQNRWMAAPVLAAAALPVAAEGAGILSARGAARVLEPSFLLPDEVVVVEEVVVVGRPVPAQSSGSWIREVGRNRWKRANSTLASDLDAEVHHSYPVEWANTLPGANQNRLANLWALQPKAHQIATNAWAGFKRDLNGQLPTGAEVMRAKMKIDKLVAPFVIRPGVSRPNPPKLQNPPKIPNPTGKPNPRNPKVS